MGFIGIYKPENSLLAEGRGGRKPGDAVMVRLLWSEAHNDVDKHLLVLWTRKAVKPWSTSIDLWELVL